MAHNGRTSRAARHLDREGLLSFYADVVRRLKQGGWLINLDHIGPVSRAGPHERAASVHRQRHHHGRRKLWRAVEALRDEGVRPPGSTSRTRGSGRPRWYCRMISPSSMAAATPCECARARRHASV